MFVLNNFSIKFYFLLTNLCFSCCVNGSATVSAISKLDVKEVDA